MKNRIIFIMILSLIATVMCACSSNSTDYNRNQESHDLQRLCRIEVYSSENDTLINTIEDIDMLDQFNEFDSEVSYSMEDENQETENKLEDYTPLYRIVAYKSPVATYNNGELEKLSTTTIFKDSNIITMEISQDAIKSFSVPSEYLTFYEHITDEKMDFLISLISFSINDESRNPISISGQFDPK